MLVPGKAIGSVVDSEPGGTGLKARCGRYLPLVNTYICSDPQFQVCENYSYLFNLRSNIGKSSCINTHFIPNYCDVNL